MRALRLGLGAAAGRLVRGFHSIVHGRGGVTLSGKVLITYTDACTKHKQEARHGRQRGDDSHKSQVALTPAELAPDVQQYDEGDEQQAQHEDGCRATAQPSRSHSGRQPCKSLTWLSRWPRSPHLSAGAFATRTRIGQVAARAATAARVAATGARTSSGRERRPCRSGGCQRRRYRLQACCPLFSGPDPCAPEHRRSPGARPSLPAAW